MRASIVALLLFCTVTLIACGDDGGVTATTTGHTLATDETADPWQAYRSRPLALPSLDPGSTCPTTTTARVSDAVAPASGGGPIYPVLGDGGMDLGDGKVEGGWEYVKVLWLSDATYDGTVLIRGGQIDGHNELRFQSGADPAMELELPNEGWATNPEMEPGWRAWPSYTRIKGPGCYAYQIDGSDFTLSVVFEAVLTASPSQGG